MTKQIKCYLAGPITGLKGYQIVTRSLEGQAAARKAGIIPLDPVEEEGIKSSEDYVFAPIKKLKVFWKRDKEMLAEADCLIDLDANRKSDGVYWEMGIMKFKYQKPVVRVYPDGLPKTAISLLEADYVTDSVADGMTWIKTHVTSGRS